MSDELKATAEKYFEAYPNEDVLFITSDGQVFLNSNSNDARVHQGNIDKNQSVTTIYRKDLEEQSEDETGDEVPDETFTKEEIINWLGAREVEADMKESKKELLDKVLAFIKGEDESEGEGEEGEGENQ